MDPGKTPSRPESVHPSKAALFGHPIHPMLVTFPIAFLVGTLFSDLAYAILGNPFWAQVSLWLVGTGFVTGGVAALFGLIDFATIARARDNLAGWVHFLGNLAALAVTLANLLLRVPGPEAAVLPWGLALSALVTLMLGVTGWYGGELIYRYRVGVAEEKREGPAPEDGTRGALAR